VAGAVGGAMAGMGIAARITAIAFGTGAISYPAAIEYGAVSIGLSSSASSYIDSMNEYMQNSMKNKIYQLLPIGVLLFILITIFYPLTIFLLFHNELSIKIIISKANILNSLGGTIIFLIFVYFISLHKNRHRKTNQ